MISVAPTGHAAPGAGTLGPVLRRFLTPGWLARHALLVAAVALLVAIGWWQLDKGRGPGGWQNYGYAVQWLLFAAFAVFLWVKALLDELDPSRVDAREEQTHLPVVQPQAPAPTDDEDDELAAYNRRLAELAERQRR